jgi:hypothetical protein
MNVTLGFRRVNWTTAFNKDGIDQLKISVKELRVLILTFGNY